MQNQELHIETINMYIHGMYSVEHDSESTWSYHVTSPPPHKLTKTVEAPL